MNKSIGKNGQHKKRFQLGFLNVPVSKEDVF